MSRLTPYSTPGCRALLAPPRTGLCHSCKAGKAPKGDGVSRAPRQVTLPLLQRQLDQGGTND